MSWLDNWLPQHSHLTPDVVENFCALIRATNELKEGSVVPPTDMVRWGYSKRTAHLVASPPITSTHSHWGLDITGSLVRGAWSYIEVDDVEWYS